MELPAIYNDPAHDGHSIEVHRVENNRHGLIVRASDGKGGSIDVYLPVALVTKLSGKLMEWAEEYTRGA